ncbi:hypothetical protein D3C87_1161560 [compost metagenome]
MPDWTVLELLTTPFSSNSTVPLPGYGPSVAVTSHEKLIILFWVSPTVNATEVAVPVPVTPDPTVVIF